MRRVRRGIASAMLASLPVVPIASLAAQSGGSDGTAVDRCDKPVGTIAVVEPQEQMLYALQRYSLQSPTTLIRTMIQQSNCFRVVERGVAMQNMQQERALGASGELQQGSNMGKGQMKTADYVLTPTVLFSDDNAGGAGGAIAGLGRHFGALGAVAGGVKFKEAQTTMMIADARSSEQVAAAQGKARKKNFALGAFGWMGGAAGALGGYSNTNEGKVIAASFLDNYNQIVAAVRADPALQRAAAGDATAKGDGVKAGMSYNEGDVLGPKIGGVKLLASPASGAKVVAALTKEDELVFLGEEKSGYLKVQGTAGEGWVTRSLVVRR